MFSIKMVRCSSPRPETMKVSVSAGYSTRSATFDGLALEALAQLAAGDEAAFAAGERRGVDQEVHGERRLVHFERRQGVGMLGVAQRVADADLVDAVDQHDVAGFGLFDGLALQAFELQDLVHLGFDVLRQEQARHRRIRPMPILPT